MKEDRIELPWEAVFHCPDCNRDNAGYDSKKNTFNCYYCDLIICADKALLLVHVPESEAIELFEMKNRIDDINTGDPDIVKFYMSLTTDQDKEITKLRKALDILKINNFCSKCQPCNDCYTRSCEALKND